MDDATIKPDIHAFYESWCSATSASQKRELEAALDTLLSVMENSFRLIAVNTIYQRALKEGEYDLSGILKKPHGADPSGVFASKVLLHKKSSGVSAVRETTSTAELEAALNNWGNDVRAGKTGRVWVPHLD